MSQRKETFLARYPRNLKLGTVVVILLALVGPWILVRMHAPVEEVAQEEAQQMPMQAKDAGKISADIDAGNRIVTSTSAEALNDQDDRRIKLIPAPDPHVTEDTAQGSLPRIGSDGRKPWQVYARPFNTADKRPRLAIVITGLGLSRVATDAAIARLPANVTLAFDAQSPVVGAWLARARQDGHETLLSVPMEPFDYPRSDPGPNTLLTSLPNTDNLERLQWALRQGSGYVGITTLSGSRFATNPGKVESMLEALRKRGLMVFDARVAPHSAISDLARENRIPVAVNTGRIDQDLTPEGIDAALSQLEQTARLTGRAIGITAPLPIVLDRLKSWLKDLPDHGIALAPVSAMVQ